MDLYLVPNNPENTVLVSVNGVAHYQIRTLKPKHGPHLTLIQRPADSTEDSIVAEVEWRHWDKPTIFRSPLLSGVGQSIGTQGVGVLASHYLHKRRKFSSLRYFIGDDAMEYCWKTLKGLGCILTCCDTRTEIARFTTVRCHEGLFAGEWKSVLQLNPCSVDIDLIVLTFLIIEKKRRERDGDPIHLTPHDEDPLGDGGGSGEGEPGVVGEL